MIRASVLFFVLLRNLEAKCVILLFVAANWWVQAIKKYILSAIHSERNDGSEPKATIHTHTASGFDGLVWEKRREQANENQRRGSDMCRPLKRWTRWYKLQGRSRLLKLLLRAYQVNARDICYSCQHAKKNQFNVQLKYYQRRNDQCAYAAFIYTVRIVRMMMWIALTASPFGVYFYTDKKKSTSK